MSKRTRSAGTESSLDYANYCPTDGEQFTLDDREHKKLRLSIAL